MYVTLALSKQKDMPQISASAKQTTIDDIHKIKDKESKVVPVSFSQMVETLLEEAIAARKKKK